MLVRFQEPIYINKLRRFAMERWKVAACEANHQAHVCALGAAYVKAANRADRWFATVDRLTRLYRQTANS
jgi:hypothetical protein